MFNAHGVTGLDAFLDPEWTCPQKDRVIQYLKSCRVMSGQQQAGHCPVCKQSVPVASYSYDNVWLWLDSLAHLVLHHHLMLPDEKVKRIVDRNGVPPEVIDDDCRSWLWPEGIFQ